MIFFFIVFYVYLLYGLIEFWIRVLIHKDLSNNEIKEGIMISIGFFLIFLFTLIFRDSL